MVDAGKISCLRDALGGDAPGVEFADMDEVGDRTRPGSSRCGTASPRSTQARAADTWRSVSRSPRSGRRTSWSSASSTSSLIDVAFGEGPAWWLVCPYDADSLAPAVIAEARRTHRPSSGASDPFAGSREPRTRRSRSSSTPARCEPSATRPPISLPHAGSTASAPTSWYIGRQRDREQQRPPRRRLRSLPVLARARRGRVRGHGRWAHRRPARGPDRAAAHAGQRPRPLARESALRSRPGALVGYGHGRTREDAAGLSGAPRRTAATGAACAVSATRAERRI